MKYSAKEIAMISITSALTVVIGFVFYAIGSVLPIPGNKFLIFAPFLGFMLYFPVDKVGRIGTMSTVSAIFGFIMGFINIFMAGAIVLSGITSDIITLLFIRDYKSELKKMLSVAIYPPASFLWAFVMSYFFTGNKAFLLVGSWPVLAAIAIVTYGLGVIGALISKNVVKERLEKIENN